MWIPFVIGLIIFFICIAYALWLRYAMAKRGIPYKAYRQALKQAMQQPAYQKQVRHYHRVIRWLTVGLFFGLWGLVYEQMTVANSSWLFWLLTIGIVVAMWVVELRFLRQEKRFIAQQSFKIQLPGWVRVTNRIVFQVLLLSYLFILLGLVLLVPSLVELPQ